ncbi:MAG: hypothetical protein K0U86_23345 [Planctomycetes bacterium]|nr:hypothetical protein [Planctomycetota bacterium]MCH9727848.1 hypothetical protein [Planctomycetota bacterium]MCH9775484.1 hypothetical protein [Planctomycetota bacterium]
MSAHDPSANVSRLLSRLSDGELSQSEFEEVEQYLLENPEARQTYFDYVDINTGINNHTVERLKELDGVFTSNIPQSKIASLKPVAGKTQKKSSLLSYIAVAATSVMLLLCSEFFMGERFFPSKTHPEKVATPTNDLPETYVATLVRSTECKWGNYNPPQFSGQRLLSKHLFLKEGIAEFRFDSGIGLVLEGPTELKIASANSAKLLSGSVVLHGYESAPEFELVTSQAKFFDVGTEYGIKVEENLGTELHVFEGSVRIQPIEDSSNVDPNIQIVNEGVAQYIDNKTNKVIALEPDKFQRKVPKKAKDPKASREELIAYDGFHPFRKTDLKSQSKWQHGGTGWVGPWRNWRLGLQNRKNGKTQILKLSPATSHPEKTLLPKLLSSDQTGCIEFNQSSQSWRTLKKPLRLDTDAVYYLSIFLEKASPSSASTTQNQYGNISFRTLDNPNDKKINAGKIQFSIGSDNYPSLHTPIETVTKAPPISYDKPYLFIAKIVASKNSPDQVFLRVFSHSEQIPQEEPLVWTCISAPYDDSTVYEHVRFQVGKYCAFFFDELRIGTTWESVSRFQNSKDKP